MQQELRASSLPPNEFAEDGRHALIFGFAFGEGVERIDVGKQ